MKNEFEMIGDTVVAKISGRLDGTAPETIRKELPQQLQKTRFMVLDCGELEYIDSGGLGALLASLRIAVSNNGDVRLAALTPKVKMLLELTRADRVFQIFPTVEEAVASFQNQGSI